MSLNFLNVKKSQLSPIVSSYYIIHRMILSSIIFLSCLISCIANETQEPHDNTAPTAALRAPVLAPVGKEISISAERSFDPDEDPITYSFEINGLESVHSVKPEVELIFTKPKHYNVLVRVTDVHGAQAVASQDVTVREDFPVTPNFCLTDVDCAIGDECDGGICYTNGGAHEF